MLSNCFLHLSYRLGTIFRNELKPTGRLLDVSTLEIIHNFRLQAVQHARKRACGQAELLAWE